jgi:transposase InsO family protein
MPATPGGKCYFLLLVNDMSRFMWLVLLAMKDEAFTTFTAFKAWVKAEKGRKIGTLCTDQGGEFMARGFTEYCSKHGMQRHLTVLYTSEQNGIVERRNQPVLGMACSMLKAMSMPNWFWGRLWSLLCSYWTDHPHSVEGRTPYEVRHGEKLSIHYFSTFGCVAHVKQGNKKLTKLEDHLMVFIGYETSSKA